MMTEIERAQASDDAFPPAIRGHYSIVLSDSRTMLPGASIGQDGILRPIGDALRARPTAVQRRRKLEAIPTIAPPY